MKTKQERIEDWIKEAEENAIEYNEETIGWYDEDWEKLKSKLKQINKEEESEK